MPIVEFENRDQTPLVLVIEPGSDRHEIPHLACAGIRYVPLKDGEDRCCSVISEHQIEFWCGAESYEIEIVRPTPYDKLSWDICASGGWCGGIVDGKPTWVDDLLPASGMVTARHFAELAIRADGWPATEPLPEAHLRWIETKFIEHLGAESVDAKMLRRRFTRPFEDEPA